MFDGRVFFAEWLFAEEAISTLKKEEAVELVGHLGISENGRCSLNAEKPVRVGNVLDDRARSRLKRGEGSW